MPTKLYDKWITDDGLNKLRGYARNGLTDEQIASKIGISRQTLSRWKNDHPAIKDALAKSKEIFDNCAEEALYGLVTGYYITETKTTTSEFNDPVTVTITKYIKPDTTALIFWLQNRRPFQWRDKRIQAAANESGTESGVLILPDIDNVGDN